MSDASNAILAIVNAATNGDTDATQSPGKAPQTDGQHECDWMPKPLGNSVLQAVLEPIGTAIANHPRSLQKTIGPSELGTDSPHELAMKLLQRKPFEQTETPWLPTQGTAVHAWLERHLGGHRTDGDDEWEGEWEAEKRVHVGTLHSRTILDPGSHEWHVTGSIDLWMPDQRATVDWKNVGNWTLKHAQTNGPSQQYLVQQALYGWALEQAGTPPERQALVYIPRDAKTLDDWWSYEWAYDPRPAKWAWNRAQLTLDILQAIVDRDGMQMALAWASILPGSASGHEWNTWEDETPAPTLFTPPTRKTPAIDVPDRWTRLIHAIEPTYQTKTKTKTKTN